jgi:hypothetical protein
MNGPETDRFETCRAVWLVDRLRDCIVTARLAPICDGASNPSLEDDPTDKLAYPWPFFGPEEWLLIMDTRLLLPELTALAGWDFLPLMRSYAMSSSSLQVCRTPFVSLNARVSSETNDS